MHFPLRFTLSNFNPLPPHGGRRGKSADGVTAKIISIHSLRMEGDRGLYKRVVRTIISIHSLRMEGDCGWGICFRALPVISIHSLRMEGDKRQYYTEFILTKFQSTPSAWRETNSRPICFHFPFNFNPLPPHGGRRSIDCFLQF